MEARSDAEAEISWREFVGELRRARMMIVGFALLAGMVGAAISFVRPDWYEVRVIAAPAGDEAGGGGLGKLGSLVSQYSGIASLAGISLGDSGKGAEAVAVLQSELITSSYIKEKDLLPVLFKGKWDPGTKSWSKSILGKDPTVWAGNRYFARKVRSVSQDSKSGLVTMTIRWKDPHLAAIWANDLIMKTNEHLRSKALAESERNIAYLTAQAEQTSLVEARRAINALLEQEINRAMVARGRDEFALKVIDPAVASERPASFGPLMLGALLALSGGMLAIMFVLAKRALANS